MITCNAKPYGMAPAHPALLTRLPWHQCFLLCVQKLPGRVGATGESISYPVSN